MLHSLLSTHTQKEQQHAEENAALALGAGLGKHLVGLGDAAVGQGRAAVRHRARWRAHLQRWAQSERRLLARRHALDAAVIAACTHGMVKRLADYARRDELKSLQEGFADPETGEILNPAAFNRVQNLFPEPWPQFRRGVLGQTALCANSVLVRADQQRSDDAKNTKRAFSEALLRLRTMLTATRRISTHPLSGHQGSFLRFPFRLSFSESLPLPWRDRSHLLPFALF